MWAVTALIKPFISRGNKPQKKKDFLTDVYKKEKLNILMLQKENNVQQTWLKLPCWDPAPRQHRDLWPFSWSAEGERHQQTERATSTFNNLKLYFHLRVKSCWLRPLPSPWQPKEHSRGKKLWLVDNVQISYKSFICFLWNRRLSEPRLFIDMVTSCRARLNTTVTNGRLQQNIGSSYWSVLNFFGPPGLLKVRKETNT